MAIAQILIYLMVVIHFVSLYKIFEKAGRKTWEGFIPVYNYIIWLKILKKSWWWIFFFVIPFVNIVIAVALHVETMRLFGKYDVKETILCIVLPWYYIPKLAYDKEATIQEPTDWTKKKDREKRTMHDHATLFFMAPFIGHIILFLFKALGSKDKVGKKSMPAEWTDALGFAIVAATIIRTFTFEAFTIPTGSMEKTMLIGDYLFVNKLKYGPKTPETPLSIPFIHNRLPGTMTQSYVEWIKNDYFRLPGYGKIARNDIMVFNWPVGDSVILHPEVAAHDYYAFVRDGAFVKAGKKVPFLDQNGNKQYYQNGQLATSFIPMPADEFEKIKEEAFDKERTYLANGGGLRDIKETKGIGRLPNDKKENYIKRCVAIAGDTLTIVDGKIHINGVPEEFPEHAQYRFDFYFKMSNRVYTKSDFTDEYSIYYRDIIADSKQQNDIDIMIGHYTITCNPKFANLMKNHPAIDSIVERIHPRGKDYASEGRYYPIYPHNPSFDWTRDNFGPLYIPQKGRTIDLNDKNYALYKRAITAYENHSLEKKEDGYYLDGEKANSYTFESDYYWLMGDNRHGSVDSRYWGLVPDTHVVGTASFVWMSRHPEKPLFDGGIRWNRIFSFVK